MNVLPLVLAILLTLSYGASASFQARMASRRNQKAHVGLRNAEMSILRQSEREHFDDLPGELVKVERTRHEESSKETVSEDLLVNPPCARLNLFPLIDRGKEALPVLYETAAKMIRVFYKKNLLSKAGLEYKLLNAFLSAGKRSIGENYSLPIETLDLKDPDLQALYYAALKGTKKGYPPLIDYLKIDRSSSLVCLFDADLHVLTVFFGPKTAPMVHRELHSGQKQSLELETILQMANDPELAFVDGDVWKLLDFNRPKHGSSSRITLVGEDLESGISLRKEIQVR